MRWILIAVVSALGCAAEVETRLAAIDRAELALTKAYPDAPAVILSHERTIKMFTSTIEPSWYRETIHEKRLIVNEGGFKYAEVKIPHHKEAYIVRIEARSIAPDGTVKPLDAQRILQVEHTSKKDKWRNYVTHLFRFPDVRVGSVLEFVAITQRPGLVGYLDNEIAGELPVRRYSLEMLFPGPVKYAVKAYNVKSKFKSESLPGMTRVTFEEKDIPAVENEGFSAPSGLRVARWVYRAQKFDFGSSEIPYYSDWSAAVEKKAVELYVDNRKLVGGLDLAVAKEGCADRMCLVERALGLVRDRVALSEFEKYEEIRPLKDVVTAGSGTNHEKAYLLWHLLRRAGVEARLALLARNRNGALDRDFPLPDAFDHMIVFLPKQAGIAKASWLDPSCEYCSAGQIPPWTKGCDAMVVLATPSVMEEPVVTGEFVLVEGPSPTVRDITRSTSRARLSEARDLVVELTQEWLGDDAVSRQIMTRKWLPKDWRDSAESLVRARSATAQLQKAEPDQCDRARGICRRFVQYVVPDYATVEGERLLVPMTVLGSPYDSLFEKVDRENDLDVRSAFQVEDTATLKLPAGWAVDALPGPEQTATGAMGAAFEIKRDPDEVVARRTLEGRIGTYPKGQYPEIRKVTRAFAGARQKVVALSKHAQAAQR